LNVDGFAVVEMTTLHIIIITTINLQERLIIGVGDSLSSSLVFLLLYVHFHLIYINVFSEYLRNNSLPIPMSFDHEVTTSMESPFLLRYNYVPYWTL
jgi:hypothetical protein